MGERKTCADDQWAGAKECQRFTRSLRSNKPFAGKNCPGSHEGDQGYHQADVHATSPFSSAAAFYFIVLGGSVGAASLSLLLQHELQDEDGWECEPGVKCDDEQRRPQSRSPST